MDNQNMVPELPFSLVALLTFITFEPFRFLTFMLGLLLFRVEQLLAELTVHAQVDPLLVAQLVLSTRGDMITKAALELIKVVLSLYV